MSDTATVVEETIKKSQGSADNIINLQDGFEATAAKNAAARKPRWIKASASAKQSKQGEGYSTVRSGYAYDFDSTKSMASVDAVRAANVKAQVADAALTGIHDRMVTVLSSGRSTLRSALPCWCCSAGCSCLLL